MSNAQTSKSTATTSKCEAQTSTSNASTGAPTGAKCGLNIMALVFLFVRLAVVSLGIGVMYLEGQERASPGVWWVVGCVLIGLAVVPYKWERHE